MATPLHPRRIACVRLSAMITPIFAPVACFIASLILQGTLVGIRRERGHAARRGIGCVHTGIGEEGAAFHAEQEAGDAPDNRIALPEHDLGQVAGSIWYCSASSTARSEGVISESRITFPSDGCNCGLGKDKDIPVTKPPQVFLCSSNDPLGNGVPAPDDAGREPEDLKRWCSSPASPSARRPGWYQRSRGRRASGQWMLLSGAVSMVTARLPASRSSGSLFSRFPMKLFREIAARSGRSNS